MTVSAPQVIKPDHRFLFKPVENCETEGCHMDIWLPDGAKDVTANSRLPLASKYARGCTCNFDRLAELILLYLDQS